MYVNGSLAKPQTIFPKGDSDVVQLRMCTRYVASCKGAQAGNQKPDIKFVWPKGPMSLHCKLREVQLPYIHQKCVCGCLFTTGNNAKEHC